MDEPIRLKHNQFWGRRSGYFDIFRPKGMNTPFGFAFKQRRGSSNKKGSAGAKAHTIYKLLAQQAISRGYLNGVKIYA